MDNKFLYPVSVQVNTHEEAEKVTEALGVFGYTTVTFTNTTHLPYIIATNAGAIADRYTNSMAPALTIAIAVGRHYCSNDIELFLALAAMRDGEEFYSGEYVVGIEYGWGYSPYDVGKMCKICTKPLQGVKVHNNWYDTYWQLLPGIEYEIVNGMDKYYCSDKRTFRKATKEEIIYYFSTNTLKQNTMSESKVIIGYKLFGVVKTREEWEKIFGTVVINYAQEFEPVYEWEVKKGDYLYCHTDLIMDDDAIRATKGRVYVCENDGCFTNNNGNNYHGIHSPDIHRWFRPATPEEIKTFEAPIMIDGYPMEIKKDGTFGFGCTKEFTLQDAQSYRKLLEKWLTIHSPNGKNIDIELLDKIINRLPK
jgi:hypothetical protein